MFCSQPRGNVTYYLLCNFCWLWKQTVDVLFYVTSEENCDLGSSESNTVIQLSDRNSENLKVAVEQQNGTHQRKEISAVNSKYR